LATSSPSCREGEAVGVALVAVVRAFRKLGWDREFCEDAPLCGEIEVGFGVKKVDKSAT
jgi:hypothetical protein